MPWPATAIVLPRRQLPLAAAFTLHAALIFAMLNGMRPLTIPEVTPREVMVSLISQHAEARSAARNPARAEPRPIRAPELPAHPTPNLIPAPQPIPAPPLLTPRATVPDNPAPAAPAATSSASPAPVAASMPGTLPTPAPVAEAKAAPAPARPAPQAPAAPPAAAERAPATITGVEYLHPPKPDYPLIAKRAGEQGKVVLRVLVDETGKPERADIRDSAGYPRLDEAARQAVMRASFKPNLEDGRPVPVYVLVPITFALR